MVGNEMQLARIDKFPEDAKVVGHINDCPLVSLYGRVVRVTRDGHTTKATKVALDALATKRIDVLAPQVWAQAAVA